jgi:hypothetical protein
MFLRVAVRSLVVLAVLLAPYSSPAHGAIVATEICDNCFDDDHANGVDREDATCKAPADGGGIGISDESEAKAAIKCQKTIQKASLSFAVAKASKLTKCVNLAFACVQLHNGDQACLDKAKTACDKLVLAIFQTQTKAKQAIVKSCSDNGTITTSEIIDSTGLGFNGEETLLKCPATIANGSDLADCVIDRQECGVERLVVALAPRAEELMEAAGQNVAANFDCMVAQSTTQGTDAGGSGISDPTQAKAAVVCQATLAKIGVKLGKLLGASITKCVDAGESCVQLKPGDNACETKATQACGKIVAKLGGAKGALAKTVAAALKKCETADVPLTNLNAAAGLGFVAVSDPNKRCSQFNVADIDLTRSLLRCVGDQFACEGRYMVERQTPRLPEFATMLGFPLDSLSIPF